MIDLVKKYWMPEKKARVFDAGCGGPKNKS